MFEVTKEAIQEMIADEPSLATLRQYSLDQVWDLVEDRDEIDGEEPLYNALMNVMYATRPKGVT
ncbi:MAG: hypothetical protein QGG40_06325 [Myxococcota bacterium]|nr:hypothetical protein [Myxococcota bacterium]